MLTEADRQASLRPLGQPAVVKGREVFGIFRDRFEAVDVGDREVSAQVITLRLTITDSAGLQRGDPVVVGGGKYRLEQPEHDVAGFKTWLLSNAE
jgi:hypothetical protein